MDCHNPDAKNAFIGYWLNRASSGISVSWVNDQKTQQHRIRAVSFVVITEIGKTCKQSVKKTLSPDLRLFMRNGFI